MKKVTAHWSIECNCECPFCGDYVDVYQISDTSLSLPDVGEKDDELEIDVECPYCEKTFIINQVDM